MGYRNSRRDAVLVDETAQHVLESNVGGSQVTQRWRRVLDQRPKIQSAMREDKRLVQALGAKRAHQSFADCDGVVSRMGVKTILMASDRSTASNGPVNWCPGHG
jgi:hypothetical protein